MRSRVRSPTTAEIRRAPLEILAYLGYEQLNVHDHLVCTGSSCFLTRVDSEMELAPVDVHFGRRREALEKTLRRLLARHARLFLAALTQQRVNMRIVHSTS